MIDQGFTIYSVLYLVTTLVAFFVAFLSWQRNAVKGARELIALMIAIGVSAFCLIFETASLTTEDKVFWAKLDFIGAISTPVFYLLFVLRFTGKDKFISPKYVLLLFIIPIITFSLTLTNEKHHLIWTGFSEISHKTNLIEYYHGKWFWIGYIAYSYLLLFWAAILLVFFIFRHTKTFRSQGLIVFIAGLFPWIVSFLYLNGYNLVPGLDLPPLSIGLSGMLAAYAIFNIRFLDLIPVARETLVETLTEGILVLDGQNRIQDINEAAMSFLGIKNRNIIGSLPDSNGAAYPLLLDAAIDTKSISMVEIPGSKGLKTFKIINKMIKNQPGSRLVVINDITDLKRTEKELIIARDKALESDRLKSAFLANMSHEIRTPMNSILGFTDLLKEKDLKDEEKDEYIKIIQKGGVRLLNIINDIIDISKIESGQIEVNISTTNINDQIEYISSIFKPEIEGKRIQLITKNTLHGKESIIRTDREKIFAILTNLVKNAIKFTDAGFIEIGYIRKERQLEFHIKDTGVGIPLEQQKIIFERFRQGNDSLNRNYEGTGLGLSISKAYVELLGGKIWIESEPGKGSVFYFTIPYDSNVELKTISEIVASNV